MQEFIAKNSKLFGWIIAVIMGFWFFSGIYFVDILPMGLFLPLYLPFGAAAASFAYKW